ncbi:molybdopterin-dependent oxidoreductase [Halobaculum rubrum]|uniref:molybdopterin-dependent oxidoreductase n=1 Tax=Halobaculum rubrum TaxID=2872158 RepID=UPI001CA398D0|nr:molybdopterin-dependent oxidoreductase [Halobaculum rubrum]QZX99257.1 molybdopterin-dependent oxidoreductase [Halobaculum rubrum]
MTSTDADANSTSQVPSHNRCCSHGTTCGSLPDGSFSDDLTCVEEWRARDLSWHGIHVEVGLSQPSPAADVEYVPVHAMDGDYAGSVPIERAREALLAFELDGEPLSIEPWGPVSLVPAEGDADCWESIK